MEPGGNTTEKNFETVYAKLQCDAFWLENGSQCRPRCVLKHFKMGTPLPFVPAAFQHRKRSSHAFRLEMNPESYISNVTDLHWAPRRRLQGFPAATADDDDDEDDDDI